MFSVTQRVAAIKQPYGGYLPMKSFAKEVFIDGVTLNENENIHAALVGMAVDYLTRFMLGDPANKAFHISCLGASTIGMQNKAKLLTSRITGLDADSIIAACKLVGFDVCYRSSASAYKPVERIEPDFSTIENIRTMVNRSISFWEQYGPIVCSEPTFTGGYTSTVTTGDGDYLSKDTLWDFKVSKSAPTSKHSLQILMYYIMGLHSVHDYYKNITNLGFFNPRLNTAYICPVSSISQETISIVERDVICYGVPNISYHLPIPSKRCPEANDLTVSEVCNRTGIKKSIVYADIRAGRLNAYKKGNKYYIRESDLSLYLEHIKTQQITQACISIAAALLFVIFFIILLW